MPMFIRHRPLPGTNCIPPKVTASGDERVYALYQLSYRRHNQRTGLEPATSPLQVDNRSSSAATLLRPRQVCCQRIVKIKITADIQPQSLAGAGFEPAT